MFEYENKLIEIDLKLANLTFNENIELQMEKEQVKTKLDEISLEKKTQQENCIHSLKTANGQTINHNNDILEETVNFYSNLYSSKKPCKKSITNFIKDVHFSHTLNENERESCEGSITTQECLKVIKEMKRDKAPGLDGLPIDFYDTFWPLFGNYLVDVFNEAFETGKLTESQKRSVLSLIYKKGDHILIKKILPN